MRSRSAGKSRLLRSPEGWIASKAPRCTDGIAAQYRRREGLREHEVWRFNRGGGRRSEIFRATRDRLRPRTPDVPTPTGIRVDRFLADAAYRWCVSTCRSPDSWTKYLDVLARWLAHARPGRLLATALHRQVEVVGADVHDFLSSLADAGLATRSIVLHRDVLRSWFRWLWDRMLIDRMPFPKDLLTNWRVRHDQIIRGAGIREALTLAEANKLALWALTIARPAAGLAVLLQCSGGLRSIEVAHLDRVQLIDYAEPMRLAVQGKGDKPRVITLEQVVVAAWNRYATARRLTGRRGPLLRKPGGGRYSRRTVQAWAKAAERYVGRPDLASHDLRRTSVTLLMEGGATLDQVKAHAGHSGIDLTLRCYVARPRPLTATTGMKLPA